MTPRDLLPDEAIDLLQKIDGTMKQIGPVLQILKDEGFPIREHYERFQERQEWMDKMKRVFSLTF